MDFDYIITHKLSQLFLLQSVFCVVLSLGAKVKDGSHQVSHLAATQLINELDYLRSNHSQVMQAEEAAKKALERAVKNHKQLQAQIQQLITVNDDGTCARCLPGWIISNSTCYFFSEDSSKVKKNWPQSRADCLRRGADLVVIDSPEEQSGYLHRNFGSWIGLTDVVTEGKWVWNNNVTELDERYWANGEPNNHGHQGEDCAITVYRASNPWKTRFDGKCNEFEMTWICEMPSK
uniref:C-type lectin domain-containing protein n=1 Tax=Echeneis naucrates TaxID=173247 RepID=A0A665WFI3_ECHNA